MEVVDRWGKYSEGGAINVGGKPYQIIYVMVHHESGSAWLVIKHKYDQEMYEYEIDYGQGANHGG